MFEYLDAYFKKYSGRGLPIDFDMSEAFRIKQPGHKSSSQDVEALREVQKGVKSSDSEIRSLKQSLAEQRRMVSDLSAMVKRLAKVEESDNTVKAIGGRKRFNGKCDNCGKWGHVKADCPELAQKQGEDDE